MSYINFKILESKGLNPLQYLILAAAKQNKTEDLEKEIATLIQEDSYLDSLITSKLLSYIKGKKGQTDLQRLRITPKGTKLLEDIETPEIEEVDIQLFDYLCEMYLKHEDEERHIGNKKKTKMYISLFRKTLSLNPHQAYWVFWLFLETYSFTKRLEYIFFDSNKNRYGTFKNNFEDSPIYQYYDENKEIIEKFWNKKGV